MRSAIRWAVMAMATVPVSMAVAQQQIDPPAHPPQAENSAEAGKAVAAAERVSTLPVHAVSLFSSGVGYFEHAGHVEGSSTLQLQFKSDQINDVLKSLVVLDLGGGTVGGVTYPSQDPVEKILKSFEIDLSGNPSIAQILGQLRGAQVTVQTDTTIIEGTVLAVDVRQASQGDKVIETAWLNLLENGALRAVPFDQVRWLKLKDAKLQSELEQALAAVAQARDSERKPVVINFAGEGTRDVRIGYVVATPVWKTSYRLLLPEGDDKAKPALQGWAIVENQTETDWDDIDLSLVSGRPISFRQELYQPLYLPRPLVEPERYLSLRPKEYAEGMMLDESSADVMYNQRQALAAPAPSAAPMMAKQRGGAPGMAGASAPMEMAFSTVQSVARASDAGELFQYTIPNVTLPRQRSAMLPIVTDEVGIDRLTIYDARVMSDHPLYGVRLKNTTDKHLLAGPITIFAGDSYAGDAQIGNVPPGQERLLSYGVDLETLVDSTSETKETQDIVSAKLVKGILHISRKNLFTQVYAVENKSKKNRRLLIEHYFRNGWELIDSPKPVETTAQVQRFEVDVSAGKKEKVTINEQIINLETVGLLPMDLGQIQIYARTGKISQPVRDALNKAFELKRAVVVIERDRRQLEEKLNAITQGQDRIRQNMNSVDRNSEYYNRMLKQLDEQENQIGELKTQIDQKIADQQQAQKNLEEYLNNLTVE